MVVATKLVEEGEERAGEYESTEGCVQDGQQHQHQPMATVARQLHQTHACNTQHFCYTKPEPHVR